MARPKVILATELNLQFRHHFELIDITQQVIWEWQEAFILEYRWSYLTDSMQQQTSRWYKNLWIKNSKEQARITWKTRDADSIPDESKSEETLFPKV